MAVTDGSSKGYVAPGLVFGVELDADEKPVIASYWDESSPTEGVGAMRPHTLGTCKVLTQEGRMTVRKIVTFDEMCRMVRAVLPMAWLPEETDFFRLYGIEVN